MLLEPGQQGLGPTSLWFTCSSPGTEPGVWDTKTDGGRLQPPGSASGREKGPSREAHGAHVGWGWGRMPEEGARQVASLQIPVLRPLPASTVHRDPHARALEHSSFTP